MRVLCLMCYMEGRTGGSTVFRKTPSIRPGWAHSEDYYILSPIHTKHEGSRTTLPAWLLDGCLDNNLKATTGIDPIRKILSVGFDHIQNGLSVRRDEYWVSSNHLSTAPTIEQLEEQLQRTIDELLQFDPSDLVSEKLREKLRLLESEIKRRKQIISRYGSIDDEEAKLIKTRTLWLSDGFLETHTLGDLCEQVLISKNSLTCVLNPFFSIVIELPNKVTKSMQEFKGYLVDSEQRSISSMPIKFTIHPEQIEA